MRVPFHARAPPVPGPVPSGYAAVPQNPASIRAELPFRLQLSLTDLVEHRGWRHARAQALDALERGESVALLGLSGTGKTLLLRSIAQSLEGLGRDVAMAGAAVPLETLPKADVLLVDEAGTRSDADLAALAAGPPFVLAALPGFAERLPGLGRPVAPITLERLSPQEIEGLVAARLAASGRPRDLFEPAALQALARHSGGRLRLVLVLAGAALFVAEGEGAPHVAADHVDDAAEMRGVLPEDAPDPVAGPEAEPAPAAPDPQPLVAPARVRLGMERPPAARRAGMRARARLWWRRLTVAMAAAGLVLAAGAALLLPRYAARAPVVAEAPSIPAAPTLVPPHQATLPPPIVASPRPAAPLVPPQPVPIEPKPSEPVPSEPEPERRAETPPTPRPPTPPAPRPPPPVLARPQPPAATPGPAAPPRARLSPLPDAPEPVPPSPWWVERSTPPARPPAAIKEGARIVACEPANIRDRPSLQSPVVRVVSEGMVLRVFGRAGPWVQVGDSFPWGWIHSAVVEGAP